MVSAWHLWFGYRSMRWPKAVGTVLEAGVIIDSYETQHEAPLVRYRYVCSAGTFESKRVIFQLSPSAALASSFRVGTSVLVYYNPSKPSQAVLKPGIPPDAVRDFIACLILSCAMLALFLW